MGILKSLTKMGGLSIASKAVKKGKVPALMFGVAGAAVAKKKKAPKPEPQQRATPSTYSSAWDDMAAADQRADKSMLSRSTEDGDEQQEAARIKKIRQRRLSGQGY